MDLTARLAPFSPFDAAGAVLLLAAWRGTGWRLEHPHEATPSTSRLVAR